MSKPIHLKRVLFVAGAVFALLVANGERASSDDRDLLRFTSAKPYVFLILDTSASMNLAPGNTWVDANGDDPRSKIYMAKEALYEVFSGLDDIHVGFATYNQDVTRVRSKHWLYRPATSNTLSIGYPAFADVQTLGMHFGLGTPGIAGSCASPLDLVTERQEINRFSKIGADGNATTTLWIESGGATYRLRVSRAGSKQLGSNTIDLEFTLDKVLTCTGPVFSASEKSKVKMNHMSEFLFHDLGGGQDAEAGFWDWQDVQTDGECFEGKPHSGGGWEGNYDSGVVTGDSGFDSQVTNVDPFCSSGPVDSDGGGGGVCQNVKYETVLSPFGRALDRGDMIPFDWDVDNLDTFLSRLAPSVADGRAPDFRAAPYFEDEPDANGFLRLRNRARKPILVAGGDSALARSVGDFRCWYLGKGANKCNNHGYDEGWEDLAELNDSEWGCRRGYLILIGDGENTCQANAPESETANLKTKAGVRTWIMTFGGDDGPPLSSMAENGGGEVVLVNNKNDLVSALNEALGEIREESAAFASAAAPSVQAIVENKIYLSSFVPLNQEPVWIGTLDAFLKPLPLDVAGKPDKTSPNHLWDAAAVLRDTQAPTQADADGGDLRLGAATNQRRIYYSRQTKTDGSTTVPGEWPSTRRLLLQTEDGTDPDIRYDLWRALAVPFVEDDELATPPVDQTAQNRANQVLADTVAIKSADVSGSTLKYVLGDIFHSDPLVIGSPTNVRAFATGEVSDPNCPATDKGYRCFFKKHQFRRKLLTVGSNDGMLHVFDAGTPSSTVVDGELEVTFNNGTGKELFAYMPRVAMPTVRQLAEGVSHRFAVDGDVEAFDVFIDPAYTGTPDPDEREWRTVAIGSLREGGSGLFALDVTQPDKLDANNVPVPLSGFLPSCAGSPLDIEPTVNAGDCGPLPFPSALWEFDDSVLDETPVPATYTRLDEDQNSGPDLGDTWSTVNIGKIRLCEGAECDPEADPNDVVDKYVAVFGGGMDPQNKSFDHRDPAQLANNNVRGNWLYMLDIETGQVIYKRRLLGSAAADVAAVDTDQDGYLDRIYSGTITGLLYRTDLHRLSNGDVPSLADATVTDINSVAHTVQRVPKTEGNGSTPVWEPRLIFDTSFDGGTATARPRPIYHQPSVLFVGKLGRYAVAFGSGDREDLWSKTNQQGRFYVFVDDTDELDPANLPLTEADLVRIEKTDGDVGDDFLLSRPTGEKGWFLVLDADERVITEGFALSGVTFFSTYVPDVQVSGGNKNPECSKGGESNIFVVNTTNANGFLRDLSGNRTRALEVGTFVTEPYSEPGLNKNVGGGGGGGGGGPTADDLTDDLKAVMDELKKLFPRECKFGNYRIDIKTVAADTGLVFIAPVPVCLIENNWKEF